MEPVSWGRGGTTLGPAKFLLLVRGNLGGVEGDSDVAEGERFELSKACALPLFESGALDRTMRPFQEQR